MCLRIAVDEGVPPCARPVGEASCLAALSAVSQGGAPPRRGQEVVMPVRSMKPCSHPGCGTLVKPPASRCVRHPVVRAPKATDPFYGSSSWKKSRDAYLKSVGYRCQRCGSVDRVTVHHKIPRKQGGSDSASNYLALCQACHNAEHAKIF